jgi:predicted kinase
MAKIIFITGPAGAGKTTIGRRLTERFPKSVHIKVDDLRESIVNGNPTPGPWSEEQTKKFQLGRATATYMTKLYVMNGFDVVVDEVCVPEFFADQYAELFAIESIYKVMLIPSQNVVAARLLQRGDPDAHVKFLIEHGNPWLYGYLEPMPKAGWIVIDSSNLTIEQTTEEVWQRINL